MNKKNRKRTATSVVSLSAIAAAILSLGSADGVVVHRGAIEQSAGTLVATAGDICEKTSSLAAGCAKTATLIQNRKPHHVFTLGDAQYPSGSLSTFKAWYHPRWGVFKEKTYPSTGNHDTYGSGYSKYFDGAAPGPSIPRHYERDLGAWRVVSVDSNTISGARNYVQGLNNTSDHRVFIWHHAPYAQGTDHDDTTNRRPLYADAIAKGADLILYSHEHIYNRGFKDVPFFVVGTGGAPMDEDFCQPEPTPTPEVQRCIQQKLGVLFLTLMDDGSFDYDFVQPNGDMGFSLDAGTFGGSG